MNRVRSARGRGFTIFEMAVVITVLGIIGVVVAPMIVGSSTNAKATQLQKLADDTADQWFYLTTQAGTGSAISSLQPFFTTASPDLYAEGVVYLGRDYVSPSYVGAYDRSGVVPLNRAVGYNGTDFYVLDVPGSTVKISGGGNSALQVAFTNIPAEIVLNLLRRLDPQASLTTGAATTVGDMTYNCASAAGSCASLSFARRH
ncbi:type II secretion system protein [Noviherbaspirillum pedocola]|uniref:Prepilin-type N-terminal cleavage/methylation domain-containing protein n=1 Tax=Noviherbaspirillum pedocola TaxID=2801341 RepID=A0A934SSS4_9BURK|nr:prepilin-type N-terminal cleavage/methylation domain-containing protein [Noviherbaspirillum pedocola]MBK4735930.1 prepilin-type N-terminal cleavage/methylation domain-containing protein [Noviherbaspirillum pedocola]